MKLVRFVLVISLVHLVSSLTSLDKKESRLLSVLSKTDAKWNSYENSRNYDRAYGNDYRNNVYYQPTTQPSIFAFLNPTTYRPAFGYGNGYDQNGYSNNYQNANNYQNDNYQNGYPNTYQNGYSNQGAYTNNYQNGYSNTQNGYNVYQGQDGKYYYYTTEAPFPMNLFQKTTTTPAPFPMNLFTTEAPRFFLENMLWPTTPKPFPLNLFG